MQRLLILYVNAIVCGFAFAVLTTENSNGDPDIGVNVTKLITSKGYPVENHFVKTEDGFILNIQRIPQGREKPIDVNYDKRKPVVFLMHCLLCSSADWVINLSNESLGFILADNELDVWLGNVRGNTYSRNHVTLKPDQDAFWNWSWDEIAKYDLPAMLEYVLNFTKQSHLVYVGHSQGTLVAFAEFSKNHVLAKKVKLFVALAPITTIDHIKSGLKYLAYISQDLSDLFQLLGYKDFLPNDFLIKLLATEVCGTRYLNKLCEDMIFLITGFDKPQLNVTRLPVYLSHTPAGTSVRNMLHFAQMYLSKKFQMFDFGNKHENKLHYDQTTPPIYHVNKMHVPTAVFSGGHDFLADPTDVKSLLSKIPNLVFNRTLSDYEHLDFIWGLNSATKVYRETVRLIMKYTGILKKP
ncbi:uncharacterized protein TRIADDRAFT_54597 [Trichoplax adhaerens]|uniref:Lipase n=1 Tax=Trichoplax adhaerens TaxID=10228 RepID=B3RSH3_TRIAD|nr:hypothetical protein TRIADDRAFT_54597 [Trichoplax adhaerens]EDV27058.1 hypothetical protein TRIADDRAFT_54597 [Trichoplax adhaerens]|eukprot:XP_002111054.1 hypothetical protein TRIADDRAFT_54597 [Trichoplax adhaerens]